MIKRSYQYQTGEDLAIVRLQKIKNITGQLAIMAASVCLIFAILFYYMHVFFLANVGLGLTALVISSWIAWKRGFINYARFSLVIFGNLLIFILSGTLGKEGGTNLLYIPLFCALYVLYNINEYRILIICVLISLAHLVVLEAYNYKIFASPGLSDNFMHITRIVSAILALGVTVTCIHSIKSAGEYAEKTLEDAREEIKKNSLVIEMKNKELEQFVYIASHDLQEPIRTISSLADLISEHNEDKMDETSNKSLDYIRESVKRMTDLIKGLLDYSRLGMAPEAGITDLNELVNLVLLDMSSSIRESRAKISVGKLPAMALYQTEIRLLFQNLISNSIKFKNPGNAPEIEISAVQENDQWQFCVRDNGIGIDPRNHEKVFEIFQRIHSRTQYEGSGIGLAHAKKIVNLHKGNIWFDSVPGKGCSFYFTLSPLY